MQLETVPEGTHGRGPKDGSVSRIESFFVGAHRVRRAVGIPAAQRGRISRRLSHVMLSSLLVVGLLGGALTGLLTGLPIATALVSDARAEIPGPKYEIDDVRFQQEGDWFVLAVPTQAAWAHWTLANPPRIIVDFADAVSVLPEAPGLFEIEMDHGPVKIFRTSQFSNSPLDRRVRMTVELDAITAYEARRVGEEIRIYIEAPGAKGDTARLTADGFFEGGAAVAPQTPAREEMAQQEAPKSAPKESAAPKQETKSDDHASAVDHAKADRATADDHAEADAQEAADDHATAKDHAVGTDHGKVETPAGTDQAENDPAQSSGHTTAAGRAKSEGTPDDLAGISDPVPLPGPDPMASTRASGSSDATRQWAERLGKAARGTDHVEEDAHATDDAPGTEDSHDSADAHGTNSEAKADDQASADTHGDADPHANADTHGQGGTHADPASAEAPDEPEHDLASAEDVPPAVDPYAKDLAPKKEIGDDDIAKMRSTLEELLGKKNVDNVTETSRGEVLSEDELRERLKEQEFPEEEWEDWQDFDEASDIESPDSLRTRRASILLKAAIADWMRGDHEGAVKRADRCRRFYGNYDGGLQAGLLLRETYLMTGREALAASVRGVPEYPDTAFFKQGFFEKLLSAYYDAGDDELLLDRMEYWGPVYPDGTWYPHYHYLLGRDAFIARDVPRAEDHLSRLSLHDPGGDAAFLMRARLADEAENVTDALVLYRELAKGADGVYALRGLVRSADLEFQSGRITVARDIYRDVLKKDPPTDEKAWALYQMANCALLAGDETTARKTYEALTSEMPETYWSQMAVERLQSFEWGGDVARRIEEMRNP
ncbi:MAG: AMIN domain-containing protein [Candidatus Eisenbacteria bacterium]|uniref:AMIN domain-containing protein n=1 Tax=Eiseniibacteriota bacterium TaxID=2212470 RepID=A0A956SBJ5_UNCEI|nr:AMIN domain-containing protein [Candidatus Eisenbacteria bacterium]MCB9466376.1 AMIN domain-containing protein [Candidatus Eisenbacteria bacterium]